MHIRKLLYIGIILLSLYLLVACASEEKAVPSDTGRDSLAIQATDSNIVIESVTETEEAEELDCVFDTSMYRFTTEALSDYDASLEWGWDKEYRQALVPMAGGDTLALSIGGCNHFSYDAEWHTSKAKAQDTAFIIEKAQWMARHFFGGNDFKKYDSLIENRLYRRNLEAEDVIHYNVIYNGEDIQNNYEGFGAREENGRAVIWIAGYIN